VLFPGPEVDIVRFTNDGVVVTNEFIEWVNELKIEIMRLRDLLK